MKGLLATSIALTAIGAVPVHAGSVWLIMKEAISIKGYKFALDLEKLEMKSMEQCEEQGAIFIARKRMGRYKPQYSGFECLEGK